MSDPIDIKALDEYLKAGGSSDISQRYRELGREDVPPELDRHVLAQARAAVANEGAPRSRSWLRWSAPVALAASVVLVVAVVIESGVPKDTVYTPAPAAEESKLYQEQQTAQAPQFVPEAPAPTEQTTVATPPPAAAPAPPARSLAKAEVNANANADDKRAYGIAPEAARADAKPPPLLDSAEPQLSADNVAAPVPPVQSVQPISARETLERGEAEADSDLNEVAVTGSRTRRGPGRTAGPRNTISGAALSGEMRQAADAAAQAEHPDPEKWLEEIRDLRRKGRSADADREWQLFAEAYPDFHVADDDIARTH